MDQHLHISDNHVAVPIAVFERYKGVPEPSEDDRLIVLPLRYFLSLTEEKKAPPPAPAPEPSNDGAEHIDLYDMQDVLVTAGLRPVTDSAREALGARGD